LLQEWRRRKVGIDLANKLATINSTCIGILTSNKRRNILCRARDNSPYDRQIGLRRPTMSVLTNNNTTDANED
jgi:hypothetical protein